MKQSVQLTPEEWFAANPGQTELPPGNYTLVSGSPYYEKVMKSTIDNLKEKTNDTN